MDKNYVIHRLVIRRILGVFKPGSQLNLAFTVEAEKAVES